MRIARCLPILVLFGCATADGPIGPWSRVPTGGPGEGKSEFASMRAGYCVPRVSEVERPIFPGAELAWVEWPKKAPQCGPAAPPGGGRLELILVTAAPQDEVVQWYASRLAGFNRYAAGNSVIFVKGEPADFSLERDAGRVPYVWIGDPGERWTRLGYRTSIDIGQPAP
jgi:hypothetical protein